MSHFSNQVLISFLEIDTYPEYTAYVEFLELEESVKWTSEAAIRAACHLRMVFPNITLSITIGKWHRHCLCGFGFSLVCLIFSNVSIFKTSYVFAASGSVFSDSLKSIWQIWNFASIKMLANTTVGPTRFFLSMVQRLSKWDHCS